MKRKNENKTENRMMVRAITVDPENVTEDSRSIEVSLSSEFPVNRWDGDEILVHTDEAIDLSRFPLPLCVAHETYRGLNIGLIENPTISEGKLRATLRFGERAEADQYWIDVKNGIIRNISIGYQVQAIEDVDKQTYRVTRWMPYEGSLVSVPADNTVGVGRSLDFETMSDKLIEYATDEQKEKLIQRLKPVGENKKSHSEAPDESDVPPDTEGPMIPSLRRQVMLKEKLMMIGD